MKTPPRLQVDTMAADRSFRLGTELMGANPPHIADQPILARMKRIGMEAGKPFDFAALPADLRQAIESAPADGQALTKRKVPTLARAANDWSLDTDTMGACGN